ncbi:MAG TPA: DUF993 family protein [Streptosporangiaceae bacterium]|jgi:hypothetical protein
MAASRIALAAAHVVADPTAPQGPGLPARLDWDATLAFRHHLWRLGLGVAEAMDTAQRGGGLDWPGAAELIRRSGQAARAVGGLLACGAGTDQLATGRRHSLAAIRAAYLEQLAVVAEAGAQPVLLASRALAASARGPDDYHEVYGAVIEQASRPVILHWLGGMFDPALAGYWGSADLGEATATLLALVGAHASRVDGVKVSLLDAGRERAIRRALPPGVRVYTGDDFHYPELIRGDATGHSDALLGILDPIAAPAAAALAALAAGDTARYDALLAPTVPLARHLFAAPTQHYKTGIVFLAWLAGHQDHFVMVGGAQRQRGAAHLAALLPLATAAGILPDPDLAAARLAEFTAGAGAGG